MTAVLETQSLVKRFGGLAATNESRWRSSAVRATR
jgi:hypothetical protein